MTESMSIRLLERIHNHIDCICVTFLLSVHSCVEHCVLMQVTRDMLTESVSLLPGFTSYFSFSRRRTGYILMIIIVIIFAIVIMIIIVIIIIILHLLLLLLKTAHGVHPLYYHRHHCHHLHRFICFHHFHHCHHHHHHIHHCRHLHHLHCHNLHHHQVQRRGHILQKQCNASAG